MFALQLVFVFVFVFVFVCLGFFLIVFVFSCVCFGGGCLMGVRGNFIEVPAQFAVFTNHRNKGLISVNRRTSLLSHLQYPVPIKVVYKGFNALNARKAKKFGVGPKPIATREHREQIYRRFPAWILT